MGTRTLEQEADATMSAETKAQWFAQKNTQHYLDNNIDRDTKTYLNWYLDQAGAEEFYMAFFQRYAVVFGRRGPELEWNCYNPSMCCWYLINEMREMRAPPWRRAW